MAPQNGKVLDPCKETHHQDAGQEPEQRNVEECHELDEALELSLKNVTQESLNSTTNLLCTDDHINNSVSGYDEHVNEQLWSPFPETTGYNKLTVPDFALERSTELADVLENTSFEYNIDFIDI